MELVKIERRFFGGKKEAAEAAQNARDIGKAVAERALQEDDLSLGAVAVMNDFSYENRDLLGAILTASSEGRPLGPVLVRPSTDEMGRTIDMGSHYLTLVLKEKLTPALYIGPHQHMLTSPSSDERVNVLYERSHYREALPYGAANGYEDQIVYLADMNDTFRRLAAHVGVEIDHSRQ